MPAPIMPPIPMAMTGARLSFSLFPSVTCGIYRRRAGVDAKWTPRAQTSAAQGLPHLRRSRSMRLPAGLIRTT